MWMQVSVMVTGLKNIFFRHFHVLFQSLEQKTNIGNIKLTLVDFLNTFFDRNDSW